MNTANKTTLAAALALTAALAGPALHAQVTTPAQQLGIKDIISQLESAGYTAIGDVDKDDGHWEVEATNSKGQRVEIDVDPLSGAVTRERPDDQDD